MTDEKYTKALTSGYFATSDGRVFSSIQTGWRGYGKREMATHDSFGYKRFRAVIDKKRIKLYVHRLMAFQFFGPPEGYANQVRHIDGTRDNNVLENIKWGTASENALDIGRHGTQYIPEWDNPTFMANTIAAMKSSSITRAAIAKAKGIE